MSIGGFSFLHRIGPFLLFIVILPGSIRRGDGRERSVPFRCDVMTEAMGHVIDCARPTTNAPNFSSPPVDSSVSCLLLHCLICAHACY
jgi:hypothetical protein